MTSLCTVTEFEEEFGKLTNEAIKVVTYTYPFLLFRNKQCYYQFNLVDIFSEKIDLFSVDPSLITDLFVINNIFNDESITTDIIIILSELVQKGIDYHPITENGEFWMTFSDIRTFYGESRFDKDMSELFPSEYPLFYNYLME
jgi:hypothetical protein